MIPIYLMLALLPNQVNPASYVSGATHSPNPTLRQMLSAESLQQRPQVIYQTQVDLAKVEKKLAALRGHDMWSFLQPPRNRDPPRSSGALAKRRKRLRPAAENHRMAGWQSGGAGFSREG